MVNELSSVYKISFAPELSDNEQEVLRRVHEHIYNGQIKHPDIQSLVSSIIEDPIYVRFVRLEGKKSVGSKLEFKIGFDLKRDDKKIIPHLYPVNDDVGYVSIKESYDFENDTLIIKAPFPIFSPLVLHLKKQE